MNHKFHTKDISKSKFLVTGGAGFIGSHICDYLIRNEAGMVVVLDDLSTGHMHNIQRFIGLNNFKFIEGDIRNPQTCQDACKGIDYATHQAALGSVPRSIKDPITSNAVNSVGTLNMFVAARDQGVQRIVYASSSSVYGNDPNFPKVESKTGKQLSPYAVTKFNMEKYAAVFADLYNLESVGFRYFNVFGPHQDPNGPYAAVIPLFINALLKNESPYINGDGKNTRDFTYVDNAVQMNILALLTDNKDAINEIYNVGVGETTSLNDLFGHIQQYLKSEVNPIHRDPRPGDIKDSLADISKARSLLNYDPKVKIEQGLGQTIDWFKTPVLT